MNWRKNLAWSFKALCRARLRTLMSSASMAIGIAAVTMLLGVSAGAEQAFQQALEAMGKNLLSVGAERKESGALRGRSDHYETLTLGDWRAIMGELDSVARAAPIAMGSFDIRFSGRSVKMTAIGTSPEFQITNNQLLAAGRFFDQNDFDDYARVAVIGSEVAKQLFFGEQPLGERILVGNMPFIIIGLLEEKGTDVSGSSQDDRIVIPATTAQRRLLGADYIDRIFVQAASKELINQVIQEVRNLLRHRHGLAEQTADDFTIRDQASLLTTLNETDSTLERFLTGIAALTLALASLGLLAVSLLSVRERQSEIGLRLAVGALPIHVLVQFLCEAVMVSLLGALAGLLTGAVGIMMVEWLLGWQLVFTWISVLYTFLISLTLSLGFGVYPALQAAKLDPIVALKSA